MSPTESVKISPVTSQLSRKMNSILPNRPSRAAFHSNDLAGTTSSSIHSNNVHESHVQEIFLFSNERERIKSFEGWPVPFLNASTMAAAGFYYLKREDIVRCAFCGVEVGSWVEGDDPMQDHERWAPSCRFVRKLPVGNIPVSTDLANSNTTDVSKENGN